MRNVMTNAVAARMNFAGRGRKTGISSMNILKVIVGKYVSIILSCFSTILSLVVSKLYQLSHKIKIKG